MHFCVADRRYCIMDIVKINYGKGSDDMSGDDSLQMIRKNLKPRQLNSKKKIKWNVVGQPRFAFLVRFIVFSYSFHFFFLCCKIRIFRKSVKNARKLWQISSKFVMHVRRSWQKKQSYAYN